MAANQLVQARIDGAVKEEAAVVLAAMGLTVSDAVRLLLTKVAQEKALPFAPLVPNAVTIEAMKEARRGRASPVHARRGPVRRSACERLSARVTSSVTTSENLGDGAGRPSMPSWCRS